MPELIISKGSVAAAVQALKAGLPDAAWTEVTVASKRPSTDNGKLLPAAFIRVTRSGGGMLNRVTDRSALLVECYHNGGKGENLANSAIAVLRRAAGQRTRYAGAFLRGMSDDDVFGPVEFPDPLIPSHDRYQFTCQLLVSTN